MSAKILTFEQSNAFRFLTNLENNNPGLLTTKSNFTTKVNRGLGNSVKDHPELNNILNISSVSLIYNEEINLIDMKYDR
jgi:hypothetical protein